MSTQLQKATLGGGCFWCLEAIFQSLVGVQNVISGYAGGAAPNPVYQQVCTGNTGYAEVTQITFDPEIISFAELLDIFWRIHDPTTLNRQGADVGTQYRSAIFYHNKAQKAVAEQSKRQADALGLWPNPIVTEISPLDAFYPAEDYHHNYYHRHADQPYCRVVIDPKVQKFRKTFRDKLK